MKPPRRRVVLAGFALGLAATARCALAQEDPALSIPDAETFNPPTQARLEEVESVAAASGWASVALPLRSAAVRAYGQDRLVAADAWFHVFQWAALFSEPEDSFRAHWIDAMSASHLSYPAVSGEYHPTSRPLGTFLSPEMQAWVLSNAPFSEEFFSIRNPLDDITNVFAILEGLHRRDPAKFARYASLALALAVVYDVQPPPYWPHHQVTPQSLSRKLPNPAAPFDWFTREDMMGHTYFRLTRLRAEELKFVVDAAAPLPELAWSEQTVPYPLEHFEGTYFMVKYRTDRSEAESRMVWGDRPYTLQSILSEGGICVDQAYFSSEAGKARGVPTLLFVGSGQDGRHAWFGFLDARGKWQLDAGRYAEQRLVTGLAIDPQGWTVISDHELQFLSERFRALPSFMESRVHEEFARDFLQAGDPESASHSARMAVNFERRNLPGWETLIAANAKLGLEPASQEGVLREAALALDRYPDLVSWYGDRICQSLRARGETSLANYEERSLAQRQLKGDRADLAIQQASSILSRSIAAQPIPDQIATYNGILSQYGQGAGTMFFDEIVVGFAEHLALNHMRPQARAAVERARVAMAVQPGTQFDTEVERLLVRLQD
jgi:hypothetical protein